MMNPEPHAMHRWLQQLPGDWTCESTADMGPGQPPAQGLGTEHVRALGDLWVLCEGTGILPGGGDARTLTSAGLPPDGSWRHFMKAIYRRKPG